MTTRPDSRNTHMPKFLNKLLRHRKDTPNEEHSAEQIAGPANADHVAKIIENGAYEAGRRPMIGGGIGEPI